MKFLLKFHFRESRIDIPHNPDKVFLLYCNTFRIPIESDSKHYITDKCVEWFFTEGNKFYQAGSKGKGLKKINDTHTLTPLIKRTGKTFRDIPDKVNGKYNYAKYRAYLKSPEWRMFRMKAIKHHGKVCNRCKRNELPVEVHHKTYERLFNESIDDVEILCKYCHEKEHKDRVRK